MQSKIILISVQVIIFSVFRTRKKERKKKKSYPHKKTANIVERWPIANRVSIKAKIGVVFPDLFFFPFLNTCYHHIECVWEEKKTYRLNIKRTLYMCNKSLETNNKDNKNRVNIINHKYLLLSLAGYIRKIHKIYKRAEKTTPSANTRRKSDV